MKKRDAYAMVADFETTVYDGQEKTEVWAAASIGLNELNLIENVKIQGSIDGFFNYLFSLNGYDLTVYFHNLKFDGSFILDYLIKNKFKAWTEYCDGYIHYSKQKPWDQPTKTFTTAISKEGLWYSIKVKKGKQIITFRDSLKLLPFTVESISNGFDTKHKKLSINYICERYANCNITKEEREYIANDVLVVKEALNFMFENGHTKNTIGACCLEEFKNIFCKNHSWNDYFPNLYKIAIDPSFGSSNAGEYIRKSYKGGWCYLVEEKRNKMVYNGTTADVNSLYASMMHSESGNYYPIGKPVFFKGDIPEEAKINNRYYFVRLKTKFEIKDNMLPVIQIKNNPLYDGKEWLKTSKYIDKNGKRYSKFRDLDGNVSEIKPELTLTMTDYELMKKHYELEDVEILDGCYFESAIGIFDEYINKYAEIKMNSKGAMRTLAKLFLNNLYGKFATSTDSSYKIPFVNEKGCLRLNDVDENNKEPGYIAIGSAITSYARRFTINAAQANYYGPNKKGFVYADTDSIHCDLYPDEIVNAPQHPTKLNHWKYETCWRYAKFVRQKTYIENIYMENMKDRVVYDLVKCAGMSDNAKQNFVNMLDNHKLTFDDFKIGLRVPGLLKAKRINGGTVLVETDYVMR